MDPRPSPPSTPPPPPPPSSSSPPGGGGKRGKEAASPPPPTNFFGRHRMAAAVSQLHHQIDILKEELEQLETLGESSIACRELFSSVQSVPDPLLPTTPGPADIKWERWFRGANESRSQKKWTQNHHRLTSLFPPGN